MQRLNHHHLYIFWVFAKSRSFTRTARELCISQSAVTHQIRLLESSLGLGLVDRTQPKKPELTAEGAKVLEYAEGIFESSRELIDWATKGGLPKSLSLRVGAISGLSRNLQFEFLKPLLVRRGVRFEVVTGDQEALLTLLRDHRIDLVLSSGNVAREERGPFFAQVLTRSPLVFVERSPSTRALSRRTVPKNRLPAEIARRGLFIPGKTFESRAELDAFLGRAGLSDAVVGEVEDVALLRLFASRSDFVVAMPKLGVANELRSGEVRVLAPVEGIEQKYYAITRDRKIPHPEVERLIQRLQGEGTSK
jgi:LysR family transcriptional activator of nhaA